ncbi:hypothetical protein ACFQ08_41500, partial [Streptosporangium algeriense]
RRDPRRRGGTAVVVTAGRCVGGGGVADRPPGGVGIGMPSCVTYRQQDDGSARGCGPAGRGAAVVEVGTVLPAATITLTPAGSAPPAAGDRTPPRRDPDEGGFLNILTTMGLVERYVTDWAGPEALVRGINVKLGPSAHAGETLVLTGTVVSREGEEFTVRVLGEVGLGEHVRGTVRLVFPDQRGH